MDVSSVTKWLSQVLIGCLAAIVMLVLVGFAGAADRSRPAPAAQPATKLQLAFVMLDKSEFPKFKDLEAAIKRRLPDFQFAPSQGDVPGSAIVGTLGANLCSIMFVGAPNPLGPNESFVAAAWWWPKVRDDLARRKAHVIISAGGETPQAGYTTLAQLTAAVMETSSSIGVIWGAADAVWQSKVFLQVLDGAGKTIPTSLFVSVKLGRDTQFPKKDGSAAWLGMTYGLREFGFKELEFRGFAGEPPELVTLLHGVASYLLTKGDVIKNKDTMGESAERKYSFTFEPSTLEPGKEVYRMRKLEGAPAASPSQIVK